MGQAAVDLPNSSDKSPAPLQSADDLLSQLAGAEIDRMLADADADADREKDAEAAKAGVKPSAAETGAATGAANDAYKAEVDALFRQLDSVPLAPRRAPAEQPASPPTAALPEPAEATVESPPAPTPLEASESEPEPTAPSDAAAPLTNPDQPAAEEAPADAAPDDARAVPIDVAAAIEIAIKEVEKERAGLLVRILEVINAPFAFCPDAARELLGKLAILTLMNSMGVLLYVVLFRK